MNYTYSNISYSDNSGDRYYELSNHLGNVLTVVSDRTYGVDNNSDGKIDYYNADIISTNDYYPFGMQMPGRKFSKNSYRYGFNGMEKDKEFTNTESHYDFGARIYDSRLGRFLSVDPKSKNFAFQCPYVFAANGPNLFIDAYGEEPITAIIDAVTAFVVTAGLNYVENIVFKEMDAEEAFDNIDWADAGVSAAASYGMSIFITGLGSAKAMRKLANSTTGKITSAVIESVMVEMISDYNSGKLSTNGELDIDKVKVQAGEAFEDAIIGALISQGFAKKAAKLEKQFKAARKSQLKNEVKLENNLKSKAEGKGATQKTIDNRNKKVNTAQKQVAEIGLKKSGNTATANVSSKVANETYNKVKDEKKKK